MEHKELYLRLLWEVGLAIEALTEAEHIYHTIPTMIHRIRMVQAYEKYESLKTQLESISPEGESLDKVMECMGKVMEFGKANLEN